MSTAPYKPEPADNAATAPTRLNLVVTAAIVAAELGVLICLMTPATLTLSIRIAELFPTTKGSSLSIVLSFGALFAVLAGPLMGALSDRTTAKMGKRRPFLLVGLVGSPVGLLLMAMGEQLALIVIGWCTVQLMLNASKTVILTAVYDFIPMHYRGRVSAAMGMTVTIAPMIGTWLVQLVPTTSMWIFLLPFIPAALLVIALLIVMPDQPAPKGVHPRYGVVELIKSFWINPLHYPDFGWACLNRFLVNCGFATFMGYQTYTLIDNIGLTIDRAAQVVALSATVVAVSLLVSSIPAGWLSDRLDRRKAFIAGSGATMAAGLLLIGYSSTVPAFLAAALITGIGYGLFAAIDLALVTATLPNEDTAAKAMGLSTSMAVVPQSLAPAMATVLLSLGSDENYPLLFTVAAGLTIAGSLVVIPIRAVR